MQLTPGQTNLIILLISIVSVYYFYPEYINIIIPLFTAITLYFTNDEFILSMFDNTNIKAQSVTSFIIKYKTYIMIILSVIGVYFTNNLLKSNNVSSSSDSSSLFSSKSKGESYSSTKLLPNSDASSSISSMSTSFNGTLPSQSSSSFLNQKFKTSKLKSSKNDDLFSFE